MATMKGKVKVKMSLCLLF